MAFGDNIVFRPPPKEFFAHFERGTKAMEEGRIEEANKEFKRACHLSPEAWIGVGCECLKKNETELARGRFQEAADASKHIPTVHAMALNNLGMLMANGGERDKSGPLFERAIQLFPKYADAHGNMSLVWKWREELDRAMYHADLCLKYNPWHGQGEFTRALILLTQGNFRDGWPAYESRWRNLGANIRKLEVPFPEWDGTNAKPGDSIFLYAEQGMGDTIQMLRYIPRLLASGLRPTIAVQQPLISLVKSTGWFVEVHGMGSVVERAKLQLPLFSLPRVLGTWTEADIPTSPAYLKAPKPKDWGPGYHVGIVWRGSKEHKNNLWRTSKLAEWRPVLSQTKATFHQLQVGDGLEELDEFPQVVRHSLPADMLETANRMAGMNLIISIDTSTVHLASALGVPCWMLTPRGPDFRWQTKREDSPWYPGLKLFRQTKELDWSDVMDRMAALL